MPLSASGEKVLTNFQKEYGADKGKSVFYASINSGKLPESLHRADAAGCPQHGYMDAVRRGDAAGMVSCTDRMLRGRVVR